MDLQMHKKDNEIQNFSLIFINIRIKIKIGRFESLFDFVLCASSWNCISNGVTSI